MTRRPQRATSSGHCLEKPQNTWVSRGQGTSGEGQRSPHVARAPRLERLLCRALTPPEALSGEALPCLASTRTSLKRVSWPSLLPGVLPPQHGASPVAPSQNTGLSRSCNRSNAVKRGKESLMSPVGGPHGPTGDASDRSAPCSARRPAPAHESEATPPPAGAGTRRGNTASPSLSWSL